MLLESNATLLFLVPQSIAFAIDPFKILSSAQQVKTIKLAES